VAAAFHFAYQAGMPPGQLAKPGVGKQQMAFAEGIGIDCVNSPRVAAFVQS